MRLGGIATWRESPFKRSRRFKLLATLLALTMVAAVVGLVMVFRPDSSPGASPEPGTLKQDSKPAHVFIINLENTGYHRAWGQDSLAPYLSQTLRSEGVLLENYYAIYHSSLPNYIAQISGQGPNVNTANDCAVFHRFSAQTTSVFGQADGKGCIYPKAIPTIVGQLQSNGLTWRGYMEDMAKPCLHPEPGTADPNKRAKVGNQYVTRHNPFMYFANIINSPTCEQNVVNLDALPGDLESVATTPNFSFITPNLCNDGHDNPCVDGRYGGLEAADAWLKVWVPRIMDSPAYKKDGMLVITFDEGDGEREPDDSGATRSASADDLDQGPGAPLPGIFGEGGGRVGALILSPLVQPGTSSQVVYNHYSLLASIEDIFSLPYIGYAQVTSLNKFGADVYNKQ
ncbi:alkaline phosphatase family protein [Arthrobacter sp. E3]|uniref:alkaline phosphatase family protein n=1 Tax=Arthrobacter sp. E3 TaxID=517402 RepID=UPI001FFC6D6A|nr:alkaline phosphatase family protein [Arthrobacter sp. E3]